MQSMFATHPPLAVRIKRINPRWDGVFVPVTREVSEDELTAEKTRPASRTGAMNTAAAVIIASQMLDNIGQTSPEQLDYAVALLRDIPTDIHDAVHEPYGARAVIYCLVISKQADIQARQLQQLREFGDTGIFELVSTLLEAVKTLDIKFRLPLIDMALPSLRQLSAEQYQGFKNNLLFLMKADHRIDLFEWSLQKILFHHLDPEFHRPGTRLAKFGSFKAVKKHIDVLMSMLVYACVQDESQINAAFAKAERELGVNNIALLSRNKVNIDHLGKAVDKLALLKPLIKPRLLKACLAVITHDQEYSPDEMELMRAIAAVLDCPLPPYRG